MKPNEHILNILNALFIDSEIKHSFKNGLISFATSKSTNAFLLHDGVASVYREYDNLHIAQIKSPTVIMANIFINKHQGIYVRADSKISYQLFPVSKIENVIEENNLWKDLAITQMYSTSLLMDKLLSTFARSTYAQISHYLQILMLEPQRDKINACEYIIKKTLISRSSVMNVFKELKKGKYITMKNGILIEINKLPKEF